MIKCMGEALCNTMKAQVLKAFGKMDRKLKPKDSSAMQTAFK